MSEKQFYFEITKRNDEERTVEGIASSEALDSDGEICDFEAFLAALPDYMKFGNLREMHQLKAAGNVLTITPDPVKKQFHIKAEVVDDGAWEKVKKKVYKGFSFGGRALARMANHITKLKLNEISLVDRPANPDAMITMFKADADKTPATEEEVDLEEVIKVSFPDLYKRLSNHKEPQMKKLTKKEAEERMKSKEKEMDAAWMKAKKARMEKALAKAADDMEEEECDKAFGSEMADITTPSMTVPEQKADKNADLLKAIQALAEKPAAEPSENDELIKALAGSVLALNEKLEKALAKPLPGKAAVRELPTTEKADDSKLDPGEADKDELAKAQKDKDPMAALRAIHRAGGTLVQAGRA